MTVEAKTNDDLWEPWHGTSGGYTNHGCRCERCREAQKLRQRVYMEENPSQRRLAVLRARIRYWSDRIEILSYRKDHDPSRYQTDGMRVSEAVERRNHYKVMLEETRAVRRSPE